MSHRPNIYDPIPVSIVRGEGCWVWDNKGKKYLDCLAGYSALSFGHSHPSIVRVAREQMDKLCLTSRAFDPPLLYGWEDKMCYTFKSKMVLPMNSGAEAVETAIKCARKWGHEVKGVPDGSQKIVVFNNNFHGRTITIISFSSNDNYWRGFGPLTPGFEIIPFDDPDALWKILRDDPDIVAVLVEPIQGEGGMNVPRDGYLRRVRDMCDDARVLLLLDEVQTGLGRTGYLLAEEHDKIEADLTILGKALGGGILPISCVLDRSGDSMGLLGPGDHGSTWGGNPLACAISMKAIDVLLEQKMVLNSRAMGALLLGELILMGIKARGRGLMIGIEAPPGTSREYALKLKDNGILVKDSHGVIRITPPLCISIAEVDILLEAIRKTFKEAV